MPIWVALCAGGGSIHSQSRGVGFAPRLLGMILAEVNRRKSLNTKDLRTPPPCRRKSLNTKGLRVK